MEQDMIDWTSFLTDDAWFLPDPPPAQADPLDARPAEVDAAESSDEWLQCPQHANSSAECCWRRAIENGPVVVFEERVAALGHFGIGFPDGQYPDTVPGSFTATAVEWGKPSSVLDDNILDVDRSQGSSDGGVTDGAYAESPHEDECPTGLSSAILNPVQGYHAQENALQLADSANGNAMVARMSSEELSADGESMPDPDETREGPPDPVACPTTLTTDQCVSYQDHTQQELAEHCPRPPPEEADTYIPEPTIEVARRPRKYGRGRKRYTSTKNSEFTKQSDSDSDYTPDPRQKKRARTDTKQQEASAAARKPGKPKKAKTWFSKSAGAAPKSRSSTAAIQPAQTDDRAVADYAPVANTAQFATTAKRARFALEATTIRQQPNASYADAEEARHVFAQLQEEFQRAKQRSGGAGTTARNMQQVVFADRAGDAVFAKHAIAAEVLISVG